MKLLIAKNIGFCSGVKRAVLMAENNVKEGKKPVQFLGTIVHNEEVIDKFRKAGGKFVKDLKKAKPGTLIIQAHGIPPINFKIDSRIVIKDATCPLVKRVQVIAKNLYDKGYRVIIIGDKNHSEIKGIKGYTNNESFVVENELQAGRLPNMGKVGVVVQTTQNKETVNKILRVLKDKSKVLKYFDTICPEVQSRQKEIIKLADKSDGILIIGSKTSANTKRLMEIAKKLKKTAWLVNTCEELNKINLSKIKNLGISSGASTPDWEIKEIIKWLRKQK